MGAALQTFFLRSLSSLVLWGVCFAAMYWHYGPVLWALVAFLVLGGLAEFFSMLRHGGIPHFPRTGLLLGGALLAAAIGGAVFHGHEAAFSASAAVLSVAVPWVVVRQIVRTGYGGQGVDTGLVPSEGAALLAPLTGIGTTVLGLVYVAFLGASTVGLLYLSPADAGGHLTSHHYLLYLVVVTKISDLGAYVTGSLLGRHPMIPRVSPKKTWEGFAGALVHSTVASVLLVKWLPEELARLGTPGTAAVVGAVLGLVAVLGDLGESVLKRATGVKDSGGFLPGIGGALDLIDSLLFTGPLLYLYLRFVPVL